MMRSYLFILMLFLFYPVLAQNYSLEIKLTISKAYIKVYKEQDQSLILAIRAVKLANAFKDNKLRGKSYQVLAYVYVIKNDFPNAIRNLNEAIRYFSISNNKYNLAYSYLTISYIFSLTNNPLFTIKYSRMALLLAENRDLSIICQANFYLSESYFLKKKNDSALYFLKQNIAISNGNPKFSAESYNNMGTALLKINKYDSAIIYLNKSLKLDPLNNSLAAMVYNNIGNAYYLKKEYNKAIEYSHRSIYLHVESQIGYALRTLAFALIRNGELKDGEVALDSSQFYIKNLKVMDEGYGMLIDVYKRNNDLKSVTRVYAKKEFINKEIREIEKVDLTNQLKAQKTIEDISKNERFNNIVRKGKVFYNKYLFTLVLMYVIFGGVVLLAFYSWVKYIKRKKLALDFIREIHDLRKEKN